VVGPVKDCPVFNFWARIGYLFTYLFTYFKSCLFVMPKAKNQNAKKKRTRKSKPSKKMAQSLVAMPQRTTASVEKSLRQVSKVPNPRMPRRSMDSIIDMTYLKCRLNPWGTGSSKGIPDGTSRQAIVGDARLAVDFSFTAASLGGCTILIVPGYPTTVYMKQQTIACTVNVYSGGLGGGITLSQSGAATGAQDYSAGWVPVGTYVEGIPTGNTVMSATTSSPNSYQASRARLVTQAFDLLYTGTTSAASGVVSVRPVRFARVAADLTSSAPSLSAQANDGTATIYPALSHFSVYDFNLNTTPYTKEVMVFRPEAGVSGILRHSGPTYQWQDYADQPFAIVSTDGGNQTLPWEGQSWIPWASSIAGTRYGTEMWLDDDWEAVEIVISQVSSAVSFRLETLSCYEMELRNSSPFMPFSQPSPVSSPATLAIVSKVTADPTVARPAAQRGDWLDRGIQFVSDLAGSVGSVAKQVGSAASIAGALAAMAL